MKKKCGKNGGKVNKGAPSGFIISLIFHGVAFFVAGIFVVFTVLPKKPPIFEAPPPAERPKMNLKKPKVKIKKSSSPKPSSRIVANVKMAKMPEISIPDLVGTGEGLMGGMGGVGGDAFGMPSGGGTHLFGGGITTGKDMEVTFYCMARRPDGEPNLRMSHQQYFNILSKFVKNGWRTTDLMRYYHSAKKLYAKCVAIPPVSSILGPISFGESEYVLNARCWVAHYRATLVHKDGITFRFWGGADDVLTAAIDREVVLAANFPWDGVDAYTIAEDFDTTRAPGSRSSQLISDGSYYMGVKDSMKITMVGSDWITLEPGEEYQFDCIVGEGPGGEFYAMLMVEIQGEQYERNDRGSPIFPLFATEPLSWETQDSILMNMARDEANVTNITTYFITE